MSHVTWGKKLTMVSSGLICVAKCRDVWCKLGRDFNFVSFCYVFIQLLSCNPKPGCLCHLKHVLITAEYVNQTRVPYFVFYNSADDEKLTFVLFLSAF